ncbi:acyl-CoA dehydrogenase family protein [Marinobacterium rhizophilum]|uniref:Acyl-CoA dehydrogenase family protein n=1 Tax=Marinobacterium rhizophilum TaxID=420402 RepID=A0ABY5HLE3_9GAMM|nr:acyl-CoA dehydrogenase family protein [Marinobacterium rhizophilum]UTW12408.1 acyl-CoA dehydrogenase family protein [Marinobacterium rhizophilum]
MNINYTAQDQAFREEVRTFLQQELPTDIACKVKNDKYLDRSDYVTWNRILFDKGWSTPSWPQQYGGCTWSAIQKYIFEEECFLAGAPRIWPFGIGMVGPVIYTFGSEEQKARFLPGIRSGDVWWCQGFSEPNAGSDLASLNTRAVRDGDHYVVNGQKTWTTMGQYADWIFCLVRTDPEAKKQQGISFLVFDMKTPGITVRPVITADGAHEVNEVFFDNVRVPVDQRIGEENKGWDYAKFLLDHERTGIARVGAIKDRIAQLKAVATRETRQGQPLLCDPLFRLRLAELEVEFKAHELTNLRMLAGAGHGKVPGKIASVLKIRGSELVQKTEALMTEAVGIYALPFVPQARTDSWDGAPIGPDYAGSKAAVYLNSMKYSIFGGSNEIQKTIIAKELLTL